LKLASPDLGYSIVIMVQVSKWGEITQVAHWQRGSTTGLFNSLSQCCKQMSHHL